MNESIAQKLKLLPDLPGVYKMYDGRGEVIYVGKAVNLKNRVRQYFQHSAKPAKVEAMVSHIEDFQYIITTNETEALTLESNLIKELKPRYNILLKDDKHFPYVRLDMGRDFPRFEVVRRVKRDGARYFGPYLSAVSLKEALAAIRDMFPVRHCKKDIPRAIARGERPCLMHHLGKCCAPCSGNVSREEYHRLLQSVCSFLEGDTAPVTALLEGQMAEAAEAMEYERAAQIRDRIAAIKALGEKQRAISVKEQERDVFAFVEYKGEAAGYVLFERGGKIIGAESLAVSYDGEDMAEVAASFLKQYYAGAPVPREVVVREPPEDAEAIEQWLSQLRGSRVQLLCPQRGEKKRLAELAYRNGMEAMVKAEQLKKASYERGEGALLRLCEIIGVSMLPERMECYDNSHIRGRDTVSGMVVFIDGRSAPREYRRFKIKSEANGDDIMAMKEVLTRRFKRAEEGDGKFSALPDLIVIDGGAAQLSAALEVLEEFGLSHIPAIGLAERNEEIILPGGREPVRLSRGDPALHLLQRIRDEAHRFAITYHRSLRARNALMSELEGIEGIGPKRRRALFEAFVSAEAIRNAGVEELAAVKGMTAPAAQKVYEYYHGGAADTAGTAAGDMISYINEDNHVE